MDRLIDELAAKNIEMSAAEIRSVLGDQDFDPTRLTAAQIKSTANQIVKIVNAEKSALATSAGKKKGAGGIRKADQNLPTSSRGERIGTEAENVRKKAQGIAAEIDSERAAILQGIDAISEDHSEETANQAIAIMAGTNERAIRKIGEKAASFKGDPEQFRQIGEGIGLAVFGLG